MERVIADLARSGSSTTAANSQLSLIAGLQASVSSASAATLAAISSEVAAAVAESRTVADQSREEAATNAAGSAMYLASAAKASRTAVADAMEAARHFQLSFASPEDERAYREREEETRRYIAEQNAKGTPEGDLNAGGAAIGQLADARAHGAHGPEFDKQWAALVTTNEKLREQIRLSGGSTKDFDDHLHESIRRILQAKGLSDQEIEAQFAAHHNDPLETAKAFVNDTSDLNKISADVMVQKQVAIASSSPSVEQASVPAANSTAPLSDAVAMLRAAGVSAATQTAGAPDHGVTTQALAAPAPSRFA